MNSIKTGDHHAIPDRQPRPGLAAAAFAIAPAAAQNLSTPHVDTVKRIMESAAYKKAVDTIDTEHERWIDEVIKRTEIEAPPFKEEKRAKVYADMFKAHGLSDETQVSQALVREKPRMG